MRLFTFVSLMILTLFFSCGCGAVSNAAGKEAKIKSNMAKVASAILIYEVEREMLPEKLEEVVAAQMLTPEEIVDPWNRPWLFEKHDDYLLMKTLGADGKVGGSGADKDIELKKKFKNIGGPGSEDGQ